MKKRNKWKIWLSDAILKHRRTYAGIPGFFKKRIVNTLCLSFLLLYGGSALGLAQRSAGFVGWTVFLTICGIGDAVYVYYLAVTRSYEVVEGTVTEILGHADDPKTDILAVVKAFDLPTEFPVLFERERGDGYHVGHTPNGTVVRISAKNPKKSLRNRIFCVRIEESDAECCYGTLTESGLDEDL